MSLPILSSSLKSECWFLSLCVKLRSVCNLDFLFLNSQRQRNSTLDAIFFSWLLVLSSRLLFHRDLKLLLSCGFKMHLAEMHDVDRCTPQIAGNHPRRIKSPFRLKIAVRMDDNWAEQEMRGCMNRELVAMCPDGSWNPSTECSHRNSLLFCPQTRSAAA